MLGSGKRTDALLTYMGDYSTTENCFNWLLIATVKFNFNSLIEDNPIKYSQQIKLF